MIRVVAMLLTALALAGCPPDAPTAGQRISDPLEPLFAELDSDGSGSLGQDELRAADPADLLRRLDLDADGAVSPAELRANLELWPEDLSRPARHGSMPLRKPPPEGPGQR